MRGYTGLRVTQKIKKCIKTWEKGGQKKKKNGVIGGHCLTSQNLTNAQNGAEKTLKPFV